MRIIELFAGIEACSKALENIGIDLEIVDAVEIDKYAIQSFNAIHNTNFAAKDISKYNKSYEDIDIITHGSPCQDFSIAGRQEGGDLGSGTRSSLLYETIRIVKQNRPKYILWENVKNLLSEKHKHNFENYINILDEIGYNSYYQVLNAKDYGIPQNRERIFTISIRKDVDKNNFKFPEKEELKLRLKDMLEDTPDEKYYINDGTLNNILSDNQAGFLSGGKWDKINESCRRYYKEDGISPTIHTCQGGNTEPKILVKNATKQGYMEAVEGDSINLAYPNSTTRRGRVGHQVSQTLTANNNMAVLDSETRIRKLTPKECWRLMGFNDDDFEIVKNIPTSNTQLYKQAGNSIVVKVLEKIFIKLLNIKKEDISKYINKILLGDSYKLIRKIPDNSIDLIITDPPYEYTTGGTNNYVANRPYHKEYYKVAINTNNLNERKVKNRVEIKHISSGINYSILDEFDRIMKKINIYIWCSKHQVEPLLKHYLDKGCNIEILTWYKTNPLPTMNNTYANDTEYCIFARETGVQLNGNYETKRKYYVTNINKRDKDKFKHPTIKPLQIIKNLIINSSSEGDIVLDCFSGSGTTCVAAKELNRQFIGIEIDPEYHKISIDRLEGILANGQTSMFMN